MDMVTFPDPSEGSMLYGYIIMLLVFLAASFTVHRLKKANKRQKNNEKKNHEMYEMIDEQNNLNNIK